MTAPVEEKKNESGSFRREYQEKRRRVTPLAVDTERVSEYADENKSAHIKRTEQFQRAGERGSTLRPSSRGDRPRCVTRLHCVDDKDEKRSRFEIISPTFSEKAQPGRRMVPLKVPR